MEPHCGIPTPTLRPCRSSPPCYMETSRDPLLQCLLTWLLAVDADPFYCLHLTPTRAPWSPPSDLRCLLTWLLAGAVSPSTLTRATASIWRRPEPHGHLHDQHVLES